MSPQIAVLLSQDGLTNGAIYALLALALVLVFSVTRVLFVPIGEFAALGALTLAAVQAGQVPAAFGLMAAAVWGATLVDGVQAWRTQRLHAQRWVLLRGVLLPLLLGGLLRALPLATLSQPLQLLLALAVMVPMGPALYRLVFQPMAQAPVLVLLIGAMALHLVLVGAGLWVYGPDGAQTTPFIDGAVKLGFARLKLQALWVIGVCSVAIIGLFLLFERTLAGKALRAAAMNRVGAKLMGISPVLAGRATFAVAAFLGALCGMLIAPITPLYYDSGFLLGLKGFVAAIIGALVSYPGAALGALLVGLLESYSAFWASAYKEVIVFTLIIPVLLWRSLGARHVEEEE